jgi:hypothetical protein
MFRTSSVHHQERFVEALNVVIRVLLDTSSRYEVNGIFHVIHTAMLTSYRCLFMLLLINNIKCTAFAEKIEKTTAYKFKNVSIISNR